MGTTLRLSALLSEIFFFFQDNLMRFKKKTYNFERKEEITHFFGDFIDYWTEDKMWSISESIKPRNRRNNSR